MSESEVTSIGKYIYVRECAQPPERKTKRWAVVAKDGEIGLGEVRWYGRWRCFAYFPLNETLYEKTCLRDIANFCEAKTRQQLSGEKSNV